MKEATGEFSMTVVTIVAVVAIAGVIAFLMPALQEFINSTFQSAGSGVVENAGNNN